MQFEMPLPPRGLSPNRGATHWGPKHGFTADYREEARIRCLSQINLGAQRKARWTYPARVRVRLTFGTGWRHETNCRCPSDALYRPTDDDNAMAACKALYDGIVAAGTVKNDTVRYMLRERVEIDPARGPGVFVRIEAMEETP